MYVVDTNVFWALSYFYPNRFPTIWDRIESLASRGELGSVREVRKELERNSPSDYLANWVKRHSEIFSVPTIEEQHLVREIFRTEQYRGLVRRQNILKGLPVADPFLIAAAKIHGGRVVTQESLKPGAARIPTVCQSIGVECIDLEKFLELENLKY